MFVISEEVAEVLNNMTPETRRVGLGNVIKNLQTEFNKAGEADGYAPLDGNAKVPLANMPASVFTYKGAWNAATNTPELADGVGTSGDTYRVTNAGSVDFGAGAISFAVGDKAIYNGTLWEKWDVQDDAAATWRVSYNGQAGYGSTSNKIPYFTNKNTDTSDGGVTLNNSAVNGLSCEITVAGIYAVTFWSNTTGVLQAGLSLNSSQLTTIISSITAADRLVTSDSSTGNNVAVTWVGPLVPGDVIRPHTSGAAAVTAAQCGFTLSKIG